MINITLLRVLRYKFLHATKTNTRLRQLLVSTLYLLNKFISSIETIYKNVNGVIKDIIYDLICKSLF